jgi:hypothetical protein
MLASCDFDKLRTPLKDGAYPMTTLDASGYQAGSKPVSPDKVRVTRRQGIARMHVGSAVNEPRCGAQCGEQKNAHR